MSETNTQFPVQPLGERIFVERDAPDAQIGTIQLAADAQREKQTGVIVAISPSLPDTLGLAIGQRVLFSAFGGQEAETEGRKFLVLNALHDVQGVVI